MSPDRRAVLAAIGATIAASGCLTDTETTPTDDRATPTASTPTDGSPTRTPGGAFADVPCPSGTETDRTVCWHTRAEDAPVVVEPSATTFRPAEGTGTVETIGFTLRNRSDRAFGCNPHAWQLRVRDGDRWRRVAPDEWIEPWYTVQPGDTYNWVLATDQHPTPGGEETVHIVEPLEPGTYAFAVHGFLGEETDRPENVECVALFDVADVVQDTQEPTPAEG